MQIRKQRSCYKAIRLRAEDFAIAVTKHFMDTRPDWMYNRYSSCTGARLYIVIKFARECYFDAANYKFSRLLHGDDMQK